jgi:hypothetical protein
MAKLLEYPTEVRLRIYKALFEGVKVNLELSSEFKLSVRDKKATRILRTSQQLRAEAMPVFHATVWFRGPFNVFSLLDAFGKDYGGLVDVSKFAKINIDQSNYRGHHSHKEHEELACVAAWVGHFPMLQVVHCQFRYIPRPSRSFLKSNVKATELYTSATLRQSELGKIMPVKVASATSGITNFETFVRVIELLSAKLGAAIDNKPRFIIEMESDHALDGAGPYDGVSFPLPLVVVKLSVSRQLASTCGRSD